MITWSPDAKKEGAEGNFDGRFLGKGAIWPPFLEIQLISSRGTRAVASRCREGYGAANGTGTARNWMASLFSSDFRAKNLDFMRHFTDKGRKFHKNSESIYFLIDSLLEI